MSQQDQEQAIDIKNSHAYKTIEAFRQGYRSKGLEPDPEKDFPNDEKVQLRTLEEFNARLDPTKGINKKIISMVRQPVSSKENGKRIVRDSLVYHCRIEGYTYADIPIAVEVSYGSYLSPNLQFQLQDNSRPFDPITGEKIGKYTNNGSIWNHYIFLPDNPKERTKQLNELLEDWDMVPEEVINLIYRTPNANNNHRSQRGPAYNWRNFTELSLEALGQLQGKGYYSDSKDTLRDKDGSQIEYDRNSKKFSTKE